MKLPEHQYKITVGKGILKNASSFFNLERKVFIVTDSGVPMEYAEAIRAQCKEGTVYTVNQGEDSKSLSTMEKVCEAMMNFGLSRSDCAIAVGGGVVGDLTGFSAASYMRGIDFYNVPTTLLSQVDSSIGGKTAVNLGSVKNIVGAFYQPKGVLIDTEVLKTLSKRHFAAGVAEAVKMSLTSDKELFSFFEENTLDEDNIETMIVRSLKIKQAVVEEDEKEAGLRKILNFGHTFGHGIEAATEKHGLYHGECVALGMLPMCTPSVSERLVRVLKKYGLPTEFTGDVDEALAFSYHDKKTSASGISLVFVDEVGKYRLEKYPLDKYTEHIKNFYAMKGDVLK